LPSASGQFFSSKMPCLQRSPCIINQSINQSTI
jgi:hypothetical protein